MNILIIFDHSQDESYCLHSAIYHCLEKNHSIKIELKNLNKTFKINETKWYQNIKKIYNERINIYKGVNDDFKTQVLCSLTIETPYSFLSRLNLSKIGLFSQKGKIITTDYASPFLLLKNTPNKLNRENIYDLILNGSISTKKNYYDQNNSQNQGLKYIHNVNDLNKTIYDYENITISTGEEIRLENITTFKKNIFLKDRNNNVFKTKRCGPFYFLQNTTKENILEEIIHLSMIFSIFNIDYSINDTNIDQPTLKKFNHILESFFEAISFVTHFSNIKNYEKTVEALNLSYKVLSKYKIFMPLHAYFYSINNTFYLSENSKDLYYSQIQSNCEIMKTISKTIYHLTSQKIENNHSFVFENN